ncbi:MAG: hypothetical protein NZ516_13175, partial [Raineya sp.]|nr:hypothetical protein [Raineya sp.]
MQKLKIFGLLMVWLIAASSACNKKSPFPQDDCIEGVVIGLPRQMNDNPDLAMLCYMVVQIKNRNIGEKWKNYENCVTVPRGPMGNWAVIGQKIYFKDYKETIDLTPADC